MSSLRSSLQGLIKKDAEYVWTATHTNAFNTIKEAICQETLLGYYDKDKPVFIEVDASGQGLDAVLLQGNILEDELEFSSETEGRFLGGLSLHLNHLFASGAANYDWPFGTLPFGLFDSNLDTRDLETYPRTYSGHF